MAIEGFNEPSWVGEKIALVVLARQQRREIAMLRSLMPNKLPPSSHCPICFRDFPHAVDIHASDAERMKHLPPDSHLNRAD